MSDYPLVTLITVCLNSEKTIEETILSIRNQTYKNIEYIIIDGHSTDKTRSIINKYKKNIDIYISEKDAGLYYAFNKGIKLVNGKIFGFVNSDDILLPNAIETLVKYYNKYPKIDFIFGSVKKHWGILHGYRPWRIKWSWYFYSSHSTGFYIKTKAAKKIGPYNTKYKYCADLDYFYKAIVKYKLKGMGTKRSEIFGVFRRGGLSSRVSILSLISEKAKIRIDNQQNKILVLIIFIFDFLININKIIKQFIS
jgi:glycosyltransferase involved in cell wall biosynthesis